MRNLDLNLLVSLDALLQERNVTRAAERLGLSQPSLSTALARLRRHFDDELLSRTGNSYRLTPLAVELRDQVSAALGGVERVFAARAGFDAAGSARRFTLLVPDHVAAVIGPRLSELLLRSAPGASLRLAGPVPDDPDRPAALLGGADALVAPRDVPDGLCGTELLRDPWACVVSADAGDEHARRAVTDPDRLAWVLTESGPVASARALRGVEGARAAVRGTVLVPGFLAVAPLVAGTDRAALLPASLLRSLPAGHGLREVPCPFRVPATVLSLWWHPLVDRDPGHRFLRRLVQAAARDGEPGTAPVTVTLPGAAVPERPVTAVG